MTTYEGRTPIFYSVVSGICEWQSNCPLETAADIWEKTSVKGLKKKLNIQEQSYLDFYPEAIKEYQELVKFYNLLSEEKKNQLYNDYTKSILFASIKHSESFK